MNERTARSSQADAENRHTFLGHFFRRFDAELIEILAVCEQHEHFPAVGFIKRLFPGKDRRRDVRPLLRNGVGVQFAHFLFKRIVVHRRRTQQEGVARKRHETHAAFRVSVNKLAHRRLRALQTVRSHIGGEHGFRGINQEHDILALALNLVFHLAPLRSRERKPEEDQREKKQRVLYDTSRRTVRTKQ